MVMPVYGEKLLTGWSSNAGVLGPIEAHYFILVEDLSIGWHI